MQTFWTRDVRKIFAGTDLTQKEFLVHVDTLSAYNILISDAIMNGQCKESWSKEIDWTGLDKDVVQQYIMSPHTGDYHVDITKTSTGAIEVDEEGGSSSMYSADSMTRTNKTHTIYITNKHNSFHLQQVNMSRIITRTVQVTSTAETEEIARSQPLSSRRSANGLPRGLIHTAADMLSEKPLTTNSMHSGLVMMPHAWVVSRTSDWDRLSLFWICVCCQHVFP